MIHTISTYSVLIAWLMVLTSIFNNILFISWQSVLIVNNIEQKNSQLYIRDRVTLTNIDYKLKKKFNHKNKLMFTSRSYFSRKLFAI